MMWRMMSLAPVTMAAALVAALTAPIGAQTRVLNPEVAQYVKVDAPVVAITHARLVDGTGTPAMDDQTIVIRGEKIVAVGSTSRVTVLIRHLLQRGCAARYMPHPAG